MNTDSEALTHGSLILKGGPPVAPGGRGEIVGRPAWLALSQNSPKPFVTANDDPPRQEKHAGEAHRKRTGPSSDIFDYTKTVRLY